MNTKKKSTTNNSNFINVGSGEVVQIKKLAKMIQEIIEYKGIVKFNNKINSSVDRKMLDSTLIRKLNWRPKIFLNKGLKITINRFIREYKSSKKNFKSFF